MQYASSSYDIVINNVREERRTKSMKVQLRRLGINMNMAGVKILEDFIDKVKRPEDLSPEEREKVLEAWDTRHNVPLDKLEYVDRIKVEEDLQGVEYEKRYIELIYYYLQTI